MSEFKVGDNVLVKCEVIEMNAGQVKVSGPYGGSFWTIASDCRPVEPSNSPKIPDSSSEPMREAFESSMAKKYDWYQGYFGRNENRYFDASVEMAWQAYQAGAKHGNPSGGWEPTSDGAHREKDLWWGPVGDPLAPSPCMDGIKVGDAVVIVERSHIWRGVRGRIVSVSESNEFPLEFISDCRKRLGYFRSSSIRKIDKADPINPSHYKHLPAEAIDIIEAAIAKAPSNESAFLQGQVIKYILRCWSKRGIEDLRKAKWYLDRLVGGFDGLLAEATGASDGPVAVKRYREPTLADLANGPIACEYRDSDDEHWRRGYLVHILNGAIPFLCVNEQQELSGQWGQCRIEVGQ